MRQLIEELLVIVEESAKDRSITGLKDILSQEQLDEICKNGLTVLPPEKIAALLKNPTLLGELQEDILDNAETGGYWDNVELDEDDKAANAKSLDKTLLALRTHIGQQ